MRSTVEVIQAVMNNEPDISEEELRLCIVSMQQTAALIKMDLIRWAAEKNTKIVPPAIQLKSWGHWDTFKKGWHLPLDKRVEPHNRPGNPDFIARREMAQQIWDIVEKEMTSSSEKEMKGGGDR